MNVRLYKFLRVLARFLQRILFPAKVSGRESLNAQGGAILVCNHVSVLDPILVGCLCPRPMRFMGKIELFKKKFMARFLRALGGFPVDRGVADIGAIRESVRVLKAGEVLCLFPQGHRFPDDGGREIKNGTALLAIWSKAPVIPVHIQPPYKLFRRLHVRVGEPLTFSDLADVDDTSLREASRRIERAIWAD